MSDNLAKLKEPFESNEIEFRAGATNNRDDPTKALALAYITSRAVMDRLDSVVGPDNWQNEYKSAPNGGVLCGLSIKVNDQWITKWDGADNTNIEGVKGGLSDSFKRAAVKWGIGRYLYSMPSVWVKCEKRGNYVKIDENEARSKMFGNQSQKPNIDQQTGEVINGQGRLYDTLEEMLFEAHVATGIQEDAAKRKLKAAGYNGFLKSKSAEMYNILVAQ